MPPLHYLLNFFFFFAIIQLLTLRHLAAFLQYILEKPFVKLPAPLPDTLFELQNHGAIAENLSPTPLVNSRLPPSRN
jgi:hypothetical protein